MSVEHGIDDLRERKICIATVLTLCELCLLCSFVGVAKSNCAVMVLGNLWWMYQCRILNGEDSLLGSIDENIYKDIYLCWPLPDFFKNDILNYAIR